MSKVTHPFVVVIAAAAFVLPPSAQASNVTLGYPSLGSTSFLVGCTNACTMVPLALSGEGSLVQSPVNGAIVKWRIAGSSNSAISYTLQVLQPGPGLSFTPAGSSASAAAAGSGVEVFSTNLPIDFGDYIGVDLSGEGSLGAHSGGKLAFFLPPLGSGATLTTSELPYELDFNADVQPQPTVILVGPPSGPATGGTIVTVAGTDFTGVTAVRFGSMPASSFTVESKNRLTAVSPAASPGVVDISVTTNAGTSPTIGADHFEYTTSATPPDCIVPNLKGKKLKAAKKRVSKAGCKIGKVTALQGATTRIGTIVRQKPKAGKAVPVGTKVAVTLR